MGTTLGDYVKHNNALLERDIFFNLIKNGKFLVEKKLDGFPWGLETDPNGENILYLRGQIEANHIDENDSIFTPKEYYERWKRTGLDAKEIIQSFSDNQIFVINPEGDGKKDLRKTCEEAIKAWNNIYQYSEWMELGKLEIKNKRYLLPSLAASIVNSNIKIYAGLINEGLTRHLIENEPDAFFRDAFAESTH